jgi:hypothetical protein
MWHLPCSDKDPPIKEKDDDEGYEKCGSYQAVTNILQYRRRMRIRGTKNVALTMQ